MTKAAAKRETTTIPTGDQIDQYLLVMTARKQFVSTAINMGWQLALTILLPVIIGVKLDNHFHSTPSYTLAALFLAVGCASMVVWSTIKRVNREQAASSSKIKSKGRA